MLTSPGNPEVGPSLKLMSTSRAFNDEALARLLLQALRDPQARRRMIGRLRPRLVGTPPSEAAAAPVARLADPPARLVILDCPGQFR